MPARSTSTRRPAATRSRSGSTAASKKRPAAKRSTANRRTAAKKKSSPGLWGVVTGSWNLLARGAGGLARSVARPEEAEPLAPEHRRDGVGLAVLGLAIVLGAAAWSNGIGPVGEALTAGVRWVVGMPLEAGVGTAVAVVLLVLVTFFGLLVITATPVHQIPERLGELGDWLLGRGEDYDDEDYEDDDEDEEAEEPQGRRSRRKALSEDLPPTAPIAPAAFAAAPEAPLPPAPEHTERAPPASRPPVVDRTM